MSTQDPVTKIIGTDSENIHIIENFMDEYDRIKLLRYFENFKDDEKHHHVIPKQNNEIWDIGKKYAKLMNDKVQELYGLSCTLDRDIDFFIQPVGGELLPHTDIIDYTQENFGDDNLDHTESQKNKWGGLWSGHASAVIYINDDYLGGELYFPQHGIEIKPKPGMFAAFPGNDNYLHGIKKSFEKNRYTISIWTKFDDFK
jgi:hypothetical protein